MSDFSSGAIVDDDLDFSAAQSRSKSREAVGAKAAAWGGKDEFHGLVQHRSGALE